MFEGGDLTRSQETAGVLADRYRAVDLGWSTQFSILEAQSAAWRGMSWDVLRILAVASPPDYDSRIRTLSLLAAANVHVHRFAVAQNYLLEADQFCATMASAACSHVVNAHWTLAIEQGRYNDAYILALKDRILARDFKNPFEEAAALMNIANTCLFLQHYDEAIDWINASTRIAASLDAKDILLFNAGNLGWAYYSLGDRERAFALFEEAERRAAALGDTQGTILWLTTTGYVLQDSGDWARAEDSYRRALTLAEQIDGGSDIINSLESLAHISVALNQLAEGETYLRQLDPLIQKSGNRLDALDVMLARGRIAAGRRQDAEAENLFRAVEGDPASQITMRLGAEHELARLYEAEGRLDDARKEYVTALGTFESARAEIKNEDSKLPYFANATPIYDDYIRLLVSQGKSEEALEAADQSRARTLEQGLGLVADRASSKTAGLKPGSLRTGSLGTGSLGTGSLRPASVKPGVIAARAGATLLFYWLGEKQSWLWAITPRKTALFALPARREIARSVERYRQALLGPEDPLRAGNEDGRALYRMLVAPAKDLIAPDGRVVVLCDGVLSELNFETLLVDAANPQNGPHYWIEDADVVSAPSLLMLASSKPANGGGGKLLLVGDAVSPGLDYPELPNASVEMREIEKHFGPQEATVFARGAANAGAYLSSEPRRFSYIDFVAHGVASRTDPLDSAIILSRTSSAQGASGSEDSFKLYAREIMQHPIDARLVTIAACYGGGTRSYAGEGLVGLSWAFLRAGAHNVIGALWEVSDESAPRLMDAMYQGLHDGLPPSAALRAAKLSLLHGPGDFRRPFFWGSFQLYTAGSSR
jgi:CHAT domain-containing protein/Tfp pilus assembly protein PilF